jgi:hypothetical protein
LAPKAKKACSPVERARGLGWIRTLALFSALFSLEAEFSSVILLFLRILHFYTGSKNLKWFVIDHSKLRVTRTTMKNFYGLPEILGF